MRNFEGAEPPVPFPVCGANRDAFEEIEKERTSLLKIQMKKFVYNRRGCCLRFQTATSIRERNKNASIFNDLRPRGPAALKQAGTFRCIG